jgi:hypothetical protein
MSLASLRIRFHDGLSKNPKAQHCIADHQSEHWILATAGGTAIAKHRRRCDMSDPHCENVTRHNSDNREIPDRLCIHDADVDPVEHRAEQIPPITEGVGREWDDELTCNREQ